MYNDENWPIDIYFVVFGVNILVVYVAASEVALVQKLRRLMDFVESSSLFHHSIYL